MSNENKPQSNGKTDPKVDPAAAAEPQVENAATGEQPEAAQPPLKHPDDLIAELRREASDLRDRVLRAHAEVENMRKRTEREKEETAKYAVTRFARDILTVGDNFQRALTAVPPGAADADPALKALVEGVTMTEREFQNVLERNGVKRIDAMGFAFNPHLHQAVMEQAKPDVPAGTIIQVFQPGYVIEDRTLRPAMVVVATGGFKPVKTPEGAGGPPQKAPDEPEA
jgi:molecular chaperone GrpE